MSTRTRTVAILATVTMTTTMTMASQAAWAGPRSGADDPAGAAVSRLEADGSGVRLEVAEDGDVDFVGTRPGAAVVNPQVSSSTPVVEAAGRHLSRYGAALGLGTDAETALAGTTRTPSQQDVVRFQQEVDGAPVIGAQVVVGLRADRQLGSILSTVSDVRSLPAATVSSGTARDAAARAAARSAGTDGLVVTDQGRAVWDPTIFGARGTAAGVWRFEVGDGAGVRRLVLVDDTSGRVLVDLDQVAHLDRVVCDRANTAGSASACASGFARTETSGASGVAEVNRAFRNAGAVSDAYAEIAGLDLTGLIGISVGGVKKLASTVRFCFTSSDCPYANAFWNGTQMFYGDTYAGADDVVGHEMTHGVIDRYSELFYWGQSGAVNESIADVLGEVVDHRANLEAGDVAWEVGEDLPDGAIRNMSDPTTFGDPDRMTSPNYSADLAYWGLLGEYPDSGGVHANSGVGNKTAHLISQGGSFNGQSVVGIDGADTGLTKTGRLYVEAITRLTSGSDYADLASVLEQSCADFVTSGTGGFTSADCGEIAKAVLATELRTTPTNAPQPADAVRTCPSGTTMRELFSSEAANPATALTASAPGVWGYGVDRYWGSNATSGRDSWFGANVSPGVGQPSSATLATTAGIALPAGQPSFLTFQQWRVFEWYPRTSEAPWYIDGGTVEVDAGAGPVDTAALPWTNGPQQVLRAYPDEVNEWAGRRAFAGDSFGWTASQLDLSSFAGSTVRPSFTTRGDGSVGFVGWWLDDITVHTCDVPPAPPTTATPPAPVPPTPARTATRTRLTVKQRSAAVVVVAKVTKVDGTGARGKVTLRIDGRAVKKTVRLKKGKAILRLSRAQVRGLGRGKHVVRATYRGSATADASRAKKRFRLR